MIQQYLIYRVSSIYEYEIVYRKGIKKNSCPFHVRKRKAVGWFVGPRGAQNANLQIWAPHSTATFRPSVPNKILEYALQQSMDGLYRRIAIKSNICILYLYFETFCGSFRTSTEIRARVWSATVHTLFTVVQNTAINAY